MESPREINEKKPSKVEAMDKPAFERPKESPMDLAEKQFLAEKTAVNRELIKKFLTQGLGERSLNDNAVIGFINFAKDEIATIQLSENDKRLLMESSKGFGNTELQKNSLASFAVEDGFMNFGCVMTANGPQLLVNMESFN